MFSRVGRGGTEWAMGVMELLDLAGENNPTLAAVDRAWPGWAADNANLAVVTGLGELRPLLQLGAPERVDRVLRVLARLASRDGGDDVLAAAALAWSLAPGAASLAHRLRAQSERIDEIVASELWIQVRSYPWERGARVAPGIMGRTRKAVLEEVGAPFYLERSDLTVFMSWPREPSSALWEEEAMRRQPFGGEAAGEHALLDLLEWGCRREVITVEEGDMLISLVEVAGRRGASAVFNRGAGGLFATAVTAEVGREFGISGATVRRRARRSVEALSQACAAGRQPASVTRIA